MLPDGEKGELVFTSLTKEAFPVVRYRTRDLTRLLPGTARPGMRRMAKVTGRSDDLIILRGVNVFPIQIEEVLLATDRCGGHFVIELTRDGRMDEMTVLAEARPESWQRTRRTHRTRCRPRQEHHYRCASGRWRPKRWSARSARPSASSIKGRRGSACRHSGAARRAEPGISSQSLLDSGFALTRAPE